MTPAPRSERKLVKSHYGDADPMNPCERRAGGLRAEGKDFQVIGSYLCVVHLSDLQEYRSKVSSALRRAREEPDIAARAAAEEALRGWGGHANR
jgi:hypothetical protein